MKAEIGLICALLGVIFVWWKTEQMHHAMIDAFQAERATYSERCASHGGHLTKGQWYICLTPDGRVIEL